MAGQFMTGQVRTGQSKKFCLTQTFFDQKMFLTQKFVQPNILIHIFDPTFVMQKKWILNVHQNYFRMQHRPNYT